MPKPDYGQVFEAINPGEYEAIIKEVICIGQQQTKKGDWVKKYWINFSIPELKKTIALSNFGITNYKSPCKYPYVGLYELVSSVVGSEDVKEINEYNVYDLAGKNIKINVEIVQGYENVTSVSHSESKISLEETTAYDIEEAINAVSVDGLNSRVAKLVKQSKEYDDWCASPASDESAELRVEDIPF